MAKHELTDAYVRSLNVTSRTEITDTKETGLLLRVYPTGNKKFAFRLRGSDGKPQGAIIGSYPDVKLVMARQQAAELRRRVKSGENITAVATKIAAAAAAAIEADVPTLQEVLLEYERTMSSKVKIWQRTKKESRCEAVRRIEAVFEQHLSNRITEMTLTDMARAMVCYKPKSGKAKANGQVSRARAYMMPVMDWCAHRNRFAKVGFGRPTVLNVVDLRQTYDPASDDHDITGKRNRALDHEELGRVLPLLKWPAPRCLNMKMSQEQDIRPVALRFLLLTCARLNELVTMKWGDFRENTQIWHKPYVKTISGPPRQQSLPLSDAAITLLKGLPNFATRRPGDLVFPNEVGNNLENWVRITNAIQRESQTTNWHRHDLRRTGSTIMKELGVAPRTIKEILAHDASNEDDGASRALAHYFTSNHLLEHVEDPQKAALDKLAGALEFIERKAGK